MTISILRLGHRIFRDQRLTTHVFLTARALGAYKGFYTGQKDQSLEHSLKKTVKAWGGPFEIKYLESHKKLLKTFKGNVIHLTVYGLPFQKHVKTFKKQDLLVVVGGEKVPADIYQKADYNLSVGSQPHSEVAALGILLYELHGFQSKFLKAKLKIIPQERGKKVISQDGKVPHIPRA